MKCMIILVFAFGVSCLYHEECKAGFTSINGQPCHQCEYGRYGKRCAFICRCFNSERCDHIIGCTKIRQYVTDDIPESAPEKSLTFPEKDTTVIKSKKRTTTTPNHEGSDKGWNEKEIILYSICVGAFALVITLCCACQCRYKRIYGTFKWYQTENRRRKNILGSSLPDIPKGNIEGIYELIDESSMIDINIKKIKKSSLSVTDKNDSNCEPAESNDYLTPYESVNEDATSFNTNGNKSDSLANDNDDITSDCRSITSSSDVHERRSSFLNSYQSIIADIDIHEYRFTNMPNEPGQSEPEAQTSASGYPNSYESMITAKDLHEYISILNFSDGGSSSSLAETRTKHIGIKFQYPSISQDENFRTAMHEYTCDTLSVNVDMINDDSVENFKTQMEEY